MKIIVIVGPLASLKTTLAHRLSIDLDAVCLSKDYVKEAMAEYVHPTNKKDNIAMSNAAVNMMISVVKNNEHQPSTWIVEANFKDREFTPFIRYLQAQEIPFVSVYLYGDLDTLYSRYVNRKPHQHPVHKSSQPMSYETFKASFDYYHTHFFEQAMISFDTTTFDDTSYEKVYALIKAHL